MLRDADLVSVQEVRTKIELASQAAARYRSFSQEQVDAVVEAMAAAARERSWELAKLAVEETGYGNAASKHAKNLLAAEILPARLRGRKTVGVLGELPESRILEIAEPVGVVAAILPTTNPTSTAIYKILISLKAGNAIVLSPHPRARRSTCATIEVLQQAAEAAGAPPGLIQCIQTATLEGTTELMRHPKTGVILATGGSAMVRAAYASGKPAYGVGPGNVPVVIDESADVSEAVADVIAGKTFDFGTLCSSEQTLIAVEALRETILRALLARHAFLCSPEQAAALARLLLDEKFRVKAECVGRCPVKLARMAGFAVPDTTSVLVAEIHGIGKDHPLSAEKLSPVLALYFVRDFAAALDAAEAILRFGGLGHTAAIHATDRERVLAFGRRVPAFRVLVNTPAPHGSTGITTNLAPAMTLGCGALAGNATSDNVGPEHLFNIKRIAWRVREWTAPGKPEAVPASSARPVVSRETLVTAVERYLRSQNVEIAAAAAPLSETVADVVDRFLAARRTPAAGSASGSCGCATPRAVSPPPLPGTPEPSLPVADFVCENDVRMAIRESRKIYIGPKSIVTPAARDLAAAYDILVKAQRS